jgi:hypothetical protein
MIKEKHHCCSGLGSTKALGLARLRQPCPFGLSAQEPKQGISPAMASPVPLQTNPAGWWGWGRGSSWSLEDLVWGLDRESAHRSGRATAAQIDGGENPTGVWTVARRSQTLGQGGPVDNDGARRSGRRARGVPKAAVNSGRLMEEDAAEEMALTAAWPSAWAQGWC